MLNSFEAASLRLLTKKVNEIIAANAASLVGGNALIESDMTATAQNYCSAVSYVRALNDVLRLCQDVEDDLLGRTKKDLDA